MFAKSNRDDDLNEEYCDLRCQKCGKTTFPLDEMEEGWIEGEFFCSFCKTRLLKANCKGEGQRNGY